MRNLFDAEGPLSTFLTLISELFTLNLLWLFCCIPMFTVGASTTAMLCVTMRMVEEKDVNVIPIFFTAFRQHFRRSTALWLLLLISGVVILADVYLAFFSGLGGPLIFVLMPVAAFLAALWLMELVWAFVVQGVYHDSVRKTLRRALFTALAYLPHTAAMVGALALSVAATFRFSVLIPLWIFVGAALVAYGLSAVYHRLLVCQAEGFES